MATVTQVQTRPDVDIAAEIRSFIRDFDPVKQSRDFFTFDVQDGVVTLAGNVRAKVAHRVLVDYLSNEVDGITQLIADDLHDDETMRLNLGHALPRGVMVRVNYGSVVLAGQLPEGEDVDALIERIKDVPGVRANKIHNQLF